MPKNCDSWEALTDVVQQRCATILDKSVAPIAKKIVKEHIKTDIYDAYTPKNNGWVMKDDRGKYVRTTYQRRNDLVKTVYSRMMGSSTLFITSRAKVNTPISGKFVHHEGAFLELLESGNMGRWKGGFPRPAIGNAQKEIDNSSKIRQVIQRELNK